MYRSTKIISVSKDAKGQAVRITTEDKDGAQSYVILTADFCHYCKDDLAVEFEKFMKEKGYDIKRR